MTISTVGWTTQVSKKDKKQKKTIVESDIEYKSVEEKPTEKASAEEKNKSVDQKKKNKKENQQVNFFLTFRSY